MQEDKSQIKLFNLKALENQEYKCCKNIESLKSDLDKKLKLQKNEYFLQIPNKYISMFLFTVFGQVSIMENNQIKNSSYASLNKSQKGSIKTIFNTSFNNKKGEGPSEKISMKKLQRLANDFKKHLPTLQKALNQEFWDQVATKSLPQKYKQTYFKLQNIDPNWSLQQRSDKCKQQQKQSVVLAVKQTQQISILCFFTLAKKADHKQLDQIVKPYLTQNKNKPKPKPKLQQQKPNFKQEQNQFYQSESLDDEKSNKKQTFVGGQFCRDKLTIFWILIFVLLIPLVVDSLGTGYADKMDRSYENLNIMEKHLVKGKRQFDQNVLNPAKEKFQQINSQFFCDKC